MKTDVFPLDASREGHFLFAQDHRANSRHHGNAAVLQLLHGMRQNHAQSLNGDLSILSRPGALVSYHVVRFEKKVMLGP